MSKEIKVGCGAPKPTSKVKEAMTKKEPNIEENIKEDGQAMIKVGKPAPSFAAPAYYDGKFVNIDLDDYKGKWVLLCFYPGDFTFV